MDVVCHLYQVLPTDRWQIVAQADLRFISTTIWLAAVACPPRHAAPLTSPHCKISRCHIYAQNNVPIKPHRNRKTKPGISQLIFLPTRDGWWVCVGTTVSIESEEQAAQGRGAGIRCHLHMLPFPLFPASQVPVNQRGETHPHNSGSRLVSVTRKK
jgi:hypothetical protein